MGRWFGFRAGYRDLVRLYIGREEPQGKNGKNKIDLYEAFRAICLDEEEFRYDIRKYVELQGLRPFEVPPLIPSHLEAMKPTARNKMYNSEVVSRNFGGALIERTVATQNPKEMKDNELVAIELLSAINLDKATLGYSQPDGSNVDFDAVIGRATPKQILQFLRKYKWKDQANVLVRELEFLSGGNLGDPQISDWLVLAPLKESGIHWPGKLGVLTHSLTIKERSMVGERFGVYSEPRNVQVAKLIAGVSGSGYIPNAETASLCTSQRAVLLLYPVVPPKAKDAKTTIGFAIQLPGNTLPNKIYYKVKQKADIGERHPPVISK